MTDKNPSELIELSAGPLRLVFDPNCAMMRYVRLGELEIVRAIFAAVRDQDWNTIDFTIDDFQLAQAADHFELSLLAKCRHHDIRFDWNATITGSAAGILRFQFQGEAKSTFLRNRIGLCVLHPIAECAGKPCSVEHTDGAHTESYFPSLISPHQPFTDVRSLTHQVDADTYAKVSFSGEVFETEDQRNWTDASYKTYGTPLALPFPVQVRQGEQIEQSVTIELLGAPSRPVSATGCGSTPERSALVSIAVDWDTPQPLPAVGLSMATSSRQPSQDAIDRLKNIRPAHLRVDLWLERDDWGDRLTAAIDLASQVDAHLEIAIFLEQFDSDVWKHCLDAIDGRTTVARWLLFHQTAKATPQAIIEAASQSLEHLSLDATLVAGTNAYFAELNRNRPALTKRCAVAYSINPQVHAFDNLSLRETLEAQPWTVASATELFSAPVVISPITLRPRFNPNATSAGQAGTIVEPGTDPRQSSGFTAAWTVGVLSQLAPLAEVMSLTFYETFGPRGIIDPAGEEYPVASVFESIGGTTQVYKASSDRPTQIAALGLRRQDGTLQLMLSNMSQYSTTVRFKDTAGQAQRMQLDSESVRVVDVGTPQ